MLQSKPILAPKEESDGTRISIMSRHTKSDGQTPDERLTPDRYDAHMPEFAAEPRRVGAYYRGEVSFDEYADAYRERLRKDVDSVIALIQRAKTDVITVMCIEDTPKLCHRRLFIEFSKELAEIIGQPLETEIK